MRDVSSIAGKGVIRLHPIAEEEDMQSPAVVVAKSKLQANFACVGLVLLWTCCSSLRQPMQASSSVPTVPLRPGLMIVHGVNVGSGDVESVTTITSVSSAGVAMTLSADVPDTPEDDGGLAALVSGTGKDTHKQAHKKGSSGPPGTKHVTIRRIVLREDLENAREYMQAFFEYTP